VGSGQVNFGPGMVFGNCPNSNAQVNITAGANTVFVANRTIDLTTGSANRHIIQSAFTRVQAVGSVLTVKGYPVWVATFWDIRFSDGSFNGGTTYVDASGKSATSGTGDIHTNTTLDNLSINTSTLSVGMYVSGSGIQANTKIQSILGANSVQLSAAATATATGVAVSFDIAAGQKYQVSQNGTYGKGANPTEPGNVAGAATTQGQVL
jgi:hypothetical protein